jgi:hypothetical protein
VRASGFPPSRDRIHFFSAAGFFIHGSPGAAFRFFLGRAAFLISFFNMFRLAFLLVRIR